MIFERNERVGGGARDSLERKNTCQSEKAHFHFQDVAVASFVWVFVTMATVSMAQCAGAELSGQCVTRYSVYLSHRLRNFERLHLNLG